MKTLISVLSVLVIVGFVILSCGEAYRFAMPPGCTVVRIGTSSSLYCPDGSSTTIPDGKDGVNGLNGHSAVFSSTPAAGSCPSTGTIFMAAVDLNDSGTLDTQDGNIQTVVICDGVSAPVQQFMPVAIVDPCGDSLTINDEVFLRLYNGRLLASFSDSASGLNTRFSLIEPGNYVTTDGSGCHFTVDSNFNVINEHY